MTNLKVPVEVWTRVVGYYRPKKAMNLGKQQEASERKMLKIPEEITNAKM